MNCKSLLILLAALTGLLGHSRLFAATVQDINWTEYANSVEDVAIESGAEGTKFVYLYNTTTGKFLTSGGQYGVQGIMADMGMRFSIMKTSTNGQYLILGRVDNQQENYGSALSLNDANSAVVYLDRADSEINGDDYSRPFWKFSGEKTAYQIENSSVKNRNLYYDSSAKVVQVTTKKAEKKEWIIVTAADYQKLTSKLQNSYVNVSSLIHDGRFTRCDKDQIQWTMENAYVFQNWNANNDPKEAKPYGAFGTAAINGNGSIKQTITGLTSGLYRVACQAFLVADGNDCTYLVANGERVLIQTITQTDFDSKTEYIDNKDLDPSLKAGSIFANKDIYNTGENNTAYTNEVYVMVDETGTLTLGIENTCSAGVAYADNFQLYYCDREHHLYIDANNTISDDFKVESGTPSGLDRNEYKNPVSLHLRRAFTKDKWNAIVLPVSLSANQVIAAFGTGAKLSELEGIHPNRKSLINFKSVDLTTGDQVALKAGKCYVVCVTKDPDVLTKTDTYTYENKEGNVKTKVTVNGPIYHINGVTQQKYTGDKVTEDYPTGGGTLAFTGYYVKPASVDAKLYIVKNGNMYHLTDSYSGVYATCWTLADVEQSAAKTLTFAIDGEEMGGTTAIEGIVNGDAEPVAPAEAVYNLNGQRVGTVAGFDTLPAGVYVIKGKKVMVK